MPGSTVQRLRHVSTGVGIFGSSAAVERVDAMVEPLSGGKVPQRVPISDRAAVTAALRRDGAVILTELPGASSLPIGSPRWEEIASALPGLAFGDGNLIPGQPPVACMHNEFARNSQVRKLQAMHGMEGGVLNKATSDDLLAAAAQEGWTPYTEIKWQHGVRQNPHTDGYVYGDHVPDHIFLLMEKQNEIGGENFFVDGEAVLKRLLSDPDATALLPLLTTLTFDQTESAANGGIFQGRASKGPLFGRRPSGRLQWKRMLGADQHQDLSLFPEGDAPMPRSCWGVTPETLARAAQLESTITPKELVQKIDYAIQAESEAAGRVLVQSGEAVCIDNYRMLHAREAFHGEGERRLWRIWTWTLDSDGRPDGDATPVSSPLDIHLEQTQGSRPTTATVADSASTK